jgi:dTMP kinase
LIKGEEGFFLSRAHHNLTNSAETPQMVSLKPEAISGWKELAEETGGENAVAQTSSMSPETGTKAWSEFQALGERRKERDQLRAAEEERKRAQLEAAEQQRRAEEQRLREAAERAERERLETAERARQEELQRINAERIAARERLDQVKARSLEDEDQLMIQSFERGGTFTSPVTGPMAPSQPQAKEEGEL